MILARIHACNYREWHPWFAWFPVPTEAGWLWLETVDRRDGCSEAASGYVGPIWEYKQALTSA